MLSAGEASGDLHGAALCDALRAHAPEARLYGMGGARMAAAGMDVLEDVTAGAIIGGTEAAAGVAFGVGGIGFAGQRARAGLYPYGDDAEPGG